MKKTVLCLILGCFVGRLAAQSVMPLPSAMPSPSARPSPTATPSPTPAPTLDDVQAQVRDKAVEKKLLMPQSKRVDGLPNFYSTSRATTSKEALQAHISYEQGVIAFLDGNLGEARVKWDAAYEILHKMPRSSSDTVYIRRVNAARAQLWLFQAANSKNPLANLDELAAFLPTIDDYSLPKDDIVPVYQLQMEYSLISTGRMLDAFNKIKASPDEEHRLAIAKEALEDIWDEHNLNAALIASADKSTTSHEALLDRLVLARNAEGNFPVLFKMVQDLIPTMPPESQPILMGMLEGWAVDGNSEKCAAAAVTDYPTPLLKTPYAKTLIVVTDTIGSSQKEKYLLAGTIHTLPPETWPDEASALKAANLLTDGEQINAAKAILLIKWPAGSQLPPAATMLALKIAALEGDIVEVRKLSALPSLPPEALYWIAIGESKTSNYKESIAGFEKFLTNPGDSPYLPDAMFRMALACLNIGDQHKAEEQFSALAQNYPESTLGKKAQGFLTHLSGESIPSPTPRSITTLPK